MKNHLIAIISALSMKKNRLASSGYEYEKTAFDTVIKAHKK